MKTKPQNEKIKLMEEFLIWFSIIDNKWEFAKWVQFLKCNWKLEAFKWQKNYNKTCSMGGINSQQHNCDTLMITCDIITRNKPFFFRRYFFTINHHVSVNKTRLWSQWFHLTTHIYSKTPKLALSENIKYGNV